MNSKLDKAIAVLVAVDGDNIIPTLHQRGAMKLVDAYVELTVPFHAPCWLAQLTAKSQVKLAALGLSLRSHVRVAALKSNIASPIAGIKNVLVVASGKGGVGKSTVSVNLALALAKNGAKVGILDADIYGPSMRLMLGKADARPESNDGKTMLPISAHGVVANSIGFLVDKSDATVWRGPMASKALAQILGETQWGELDYLLLDLPPGTSDIHLTLVQTVPVTGAVIVTTPQKIALADATKGGSMFSQPNINVPILGVIENMSYFTPAELPDNKYFIFGSGGGQQLADKFNVSVLGQIPLVQKIREGGDEGRPIMMEQDQIVTQAFQEAAENLAQQIAIRNANLPKTEPVKMRM